MIADPRHASVGRLVGSPAMAQFTAAATGNGVRIDGLSWNLPFAAAEGQKALVGFWPDDIELAAVEGPDFHEGRVYATDFRGRDQAIEVRFGDHRFRKVVDLDLTLHQGDACWFRLPPGKALYFDRGDRCAHPDRAQRRRPMRQTSYSIAIALILTGIVLMCQPFDVRLYALGFPVILAGVVLFTVLDHLAPPKAKPDKNSLRRERS